MNVLQQILDWSKARPEWQRDALRRLVTQGDLTDVDIVELSAMLQAANGIFHEPSAPKSEMLAASHLALPSNGDPTVVLSELCDFTNVNALSEKQSLSFEAKGLTAIYGDNGAGKSGYVRFLKRLCRARAPGEGIRRNVFTDRRDVPRGTIVFSVGVEKKEVSWADGDPTPPELGAVSVFDTACASVYVEEETSVAYRPLGLDLLAMLASACDRVKKVINQEIAASDSNKLTITGFAEGLPVAALLRNLTSTTSTESFDKLATLTAAEQQRMNELRVKIAELNLDGHKQKSQELRNRAKRIRALAQELITLQAALSIEVEISLHSALKNAAAAQGAVELASSLRFADQPLPSVGSAVWKALWDAARAYSVNEAYIDVAFPHTDNVALCVLCQQPLGQLAAERLKSFERFVQDKSQAAADAATASLAKARAAIDRTSVAISSDALLEDLNSSTLPSRLEIQSYFDAASERRKELLAATATGEPLVTAPLKSSLTAALEMLAKSADSEATSAEAAANPAEKEKLDQELARLDERIRLLPERERIRAEVSRLSLRVKLLACLGDTETNAITRKSTELTKLAVSDTLRTRFEKELHSLGLSHLSVVLDTSGGSKGTLYHKVEIRRVDGKSVAGVGGVLSEGEQRCIALAAFLAELSTQSSNSTIVFDDPVSSLDHERRETIVRRIVRESERRPVVVFTHDLVFLLSLERFAKKQDSSFAGRQIRRSTTAIGQVAGDLPWYGLSVKRRLVYLHNRLQRAEALQRDGQVEEYRDSAWTLYGLLRETWERAVEEVWLNESVVRFGREIQTQRLRKVVDVTMQDYELLEQGMDRCSTFNAGHDAAPAVNLQVPEAKAIAADIAALESWVDGIRKRRK